MKKMLDKKEITLVLYHANCIDGLASASTVKRFYELHSLDQPKFISCNYNDKISFTCCDENVLIVDFSFDYETMKRIIEETKGNVLIIDHHATSAESLKEIADEYKQFDNSFCGAVLTWRYFFPKSEIPELLEYIQDYDLWKTESKRKWKEMNFLISYLLSEEEKKIDLMESLLDETITHPEKIVKMVKRGIVYKDYVDSIVGKQINSVMLLAMDDPVEKQNKILRLQSILVAVVNATNFINELSDRILQTTPQVDAVITYRSTIDGTGRNKFICSVRSTTYPAHLFAKQFGGGGHQQASGFSVYDSLPFKVHFSTYYSNFLKDRENLFVGDEYELLSKYFPDKVGRGIFLRFSAHDHGRKMKEGKFHINNRNLIPGDKVLCLIDSKKYIEYRVEKISEGEVVCTLVDE